MKWSLGFGVDFVDVPSGPMPDWRCSCHVTRRAGQRCFLQKQTKLTKRRSQEFNLCSLGYLLFETEPCYLCRFAGLDGERIGNYH